jgi:hypothetical protein
MMVLIYIYPAPDKWTNAYGDTVLILGTGFGVFSGFLFLLPRFDVYQLTLNTLTWETLISSLVYDLFIMLLRSIVGYAVIFGARFIVKKVLLLILPELILSKEQLNSISHDRSLATRIYSVEIPMKFIVYFCVGFNASFTGPFLFHVLGI